MRHLIYEDCLYIDMSYEDNSIYIDKDKGLFIEIFLYL